MPLTRFLISCLALLISSAVFAQGPPKPEPTMRDVSYGTHERNVLDFWKADSDTPTPLVVYIHGGGFRGGKKESINARTLTGLLDEGISVAAIHYRLLAQAKLPTAHHDSRRAIQFLRSKAGEWNIDKTRVGAFGGSAGAQICMWLAFHNEMANPYSADPIERESTRLQAVATSGGQTTMFFDWWMNNIPEYTEPHRSIEEYYGELPADQLEAVQRDTSAFDQIDSDDPPIYMRYGMAPGDPLPVDPAKVSGWKVHHVQFGVELKKRLDALGVEAHLGYRGARITYPNNVEFFAAKLKR